MDLTTLGTITSILLIVGPLFLQWVTDWYFNATKSPILDEAYFIWYYWTDKFRQERKED